MILPKKTVSMKCLIKASLFFFFFSFFGGGGGGRGHLHAPTLPLLDIDSLHSMKINNFELNNLNITVISHF